VIERLDHLHNPGMECASAVLEHARAGDLVVERVLEIREKAPLV
jgi:hypothetical protein